MSDLPPHSSDNLQISNPNCDNAENHPDEKSEELTLEIQNTSPKSPFIKTQKFPDQELNPDEQKSNLLVDIDEEQKLKKKDFEDLDQENQEEEEEENDDEEVGINMSVSPLPQSSLSAKNSKNIRRNSKRKKGCGNNVFKQKKIQILSECFNPIPFVPDKVFDFSRFEEDLRKLGLWDFAHLEFDSNVRADLLVQLIVDYKTKKQFCYVNDCRIKVSRPDFARALKLPTKKPTASFCEGESFSREFLSFLEEFVSSWMLLHECDVWVTPDEVVNCLKLIKDGQPMRVDWAGIIWFMVAEELVQGTGLTDCYYASHLQQLIKDQRKDLLENQKVEEVILEDDEEDGDMEMLDAQESSLGEERVPEQCTEISLDPTRVAPVGASDVVEKESYSDVVQKDSDTDMVERADGDIVAEMGGEDSQLKKVDEIDEEKNGNNVVSVGCLDEAEKVENIDNVECAENVESSKGMGVEVMVDFGFQRWPLDGVNDGGQHVLQRCSMAGLQMSIDGVDEDVEDETAEDEQGFNFMEKSSVNVNAMPSRNHIQGIEMGHVSYNSVEQGDQSSMGLMPSRVENDVMLNGGPSLFNNVVKREIDHDHAFSHHALNDNNKRMRMDGDWNHKPSDSITSLTELIQSAEKTMMILETEKFEQTNLIQMYSSQLSAKEDEVIQWRCKFDELQRKKDVEDSRRDRELHLMSSVIDGYRRAMKDTQMAFADYRKRCQIPDEPIYKDVGSGGVVKSVMELEKERLKLEEENKRMCYMFQNTFNRYILNYESLCEEFHIKVMALDGRLVGASKEVEQLKDEFVKRKMPEDVAMSQEVQSEAQEPQKDDFVEHQISENIVILEAQNEAQELMNDDIVESRLSENVVIPEVQSEG